LIRQFIAKKGLRPVKMVQLQIVSTRYKIIPLLVLTEPVGAGNHQPVKHREKYGALFVKLILPSTQKILDDLLNPQFPPQSFKDQRRPDFLVQADPDRFVRKESKAPSH
jgi:hypothetical protein